jgi:peptide chain release factor 2
VVVTLQNLTRELADNPSSMTMSKDEGDETGLLTIETEAAKLAKDVDSWNSAACSTTRPTP